MNTKWIAIGGSLFVIFIIGMVYLAKMDSQTLTNTETKFVTYAEKLGLDLYTFTEDMKSDEVRKTVSDDLAEAIELNLSGTPSFFINGEPVEFRSEAAIQDAIDQAVETNEVQDIPEGEHYLGPQNPKVIITEYSDFECPACATFAPIVKSALQRNSDTTGLIYKHFPLQMHPYAESAARATEAAAKQGVFWKMHDLLFESQDDWS